MSQEQIELNTIAAQLAQNGQLIQQLLTQCTQSKHEPVEQDAAARRPSYEWQPPQELYDRVRSLASPIFKQTLSDEERRSIIERYPDIQGLKYTPPSTILEAQRRFNKGQAREDSTHRSLQYSASTILRPFDTLCHELLQAPANQDSERLFVIINDIRNLILQHCGSLNNARINLALRAVNPTINSVSDDSADYIMEPSKFQETLAHHTTYHKTIKDATLR